MTASPPAAPGMPEEETIARAIYEKHCEEYRAGPWWDDEPDEIKRLHCKQASAVLSLIRLAFEAKDQRIRELSALLDKQMGTPCEQIRHQQEIEHYEAMIKSEQEAAIHWCGEAAKFNEQRLSAEAELYGLQQAILDAAVICDDDEKAGDRLDKLARAIRARSASAAARGETNAAPQEP